MRFISKLSSSVNRAAAIAAMVFCAGAHASASELDLVEFSGLQPPGQTGSWGGPDSRLIQGPDGNLYGVSGFNPESDVFVQNGGFIFQLTLSGQENIIYSFAAPPNGGANATGAHPSALAVGGDGHIYGVAASGGAYGQGTLFTITPQGQLTVLHSFSGLSDGAMPNSLITGPDGNVYGTTASNFLPLELDYDVPPIGAWYAPTIFSLNTGSAHTFSVIHQFDPSCLFPSQLTFGTDGNLWGVVEVAEQPYNAAAYTNVNVYSVSPSGSNFTVQTTIVGSTSDLEGNVPAGMMAGNGGLVQGRDGYFYGTLENITSDFNGAVFKVSAKGGLLSTVHLFNGSDGAHPAGTLMLGPDGNLYGTAMNGGAGGAGSLFQITPAGVFTTLYGFGTAQPCTGSGIFSICPPPGTGPESGVMLASDGNFYGIADYSGLWQQGTLFRLTIAPMINLQIQAQPPGKYSNGNATLTWSSNASSCTASGAWSGSLPPSGTMAVYQKYDGQYDYHLQCQSSAGTSTADAFQSVTGIQIGPIGIGPPPPYL